MSEAMLTSETEAALLRSVLSNPADDTVRLAIADYWEEAGRNERAEFCRVQVELARELRCDHECQNRMDYKCPDCTRRTALRARERELWIDGMIAHCKPASWPELVLHRGEDVPNFTPRSPEGYLSRGFVSKVTCTAADWLKHEGKVFWHPGQTVQPRGRTEACDTHDYSYPRPFPATAQPIERVVLTTEPDWEHWNPVFSQTEQAFYDDRWPGIVFEVRPERETGWNNLNVEQLTRLPIHGARGWEEP